MFLSHLASLRQRWGVGGGALGRRENKEKKEEHGEELIRVGKRSDDL